MGIIGDALNSAENDVNNVFVDRNGKPTCCCSILLGIVGIVVLIAIIVSLFGGH